MRNFVVLCLFFVFIRSATGEKLPIYVSNGLVFVDVKIPSEAKTFRFLVDTGAEESILAHRLAKKLGSKYIEKETVLTPHGEQTLKRCESVALNIGEERFEPPSFLCMDLRRESRILKTNIDGLLGMDFLQDKLIRIDFTNKYIDFAPRQTVARNSTLFKLRFKNDAVCLPVSVGPFDLPMIRVDTGCDKTLCWKNPNGKGNFRKKMMNVKLGSLEWSGIKTYSCEDAIFPGECGLLGMGILSQFKALVFDFKNNKLLLEG